MVNNGNFKCLICKSYFDNKRFSRDPHTNESSEVNWTKSYDSDKNLANANPNILLNQEPDRFRNFKPF